MFGMLLATWLVGPAHACGGFFCNGSQSATGTYGIPPVVQNSERILFRVNGDGTLTTFVGVGYERNEDVDFAWIIPIPDAIPIESVETTSASLFNELELVTAPQFTFQWSWTTGGYGYGYDDYDDYDDYGGGSAPGCGCGGGGGGDSASWTASSDPSSGASGWDSSTPGSQGVNVTVVEEAVVGPFAIEVITARDPQEFAVWLTANGYELPESAIAPLEHYIAQGMSFLGVKLAPDVPMGPIDTLVFTCPADAPTIPLILTGIAAAEDLAITAYILADEPWSPSTWAMTEDIAPQTLPDGEGATDYLKRVEAAVSPWEGKAFVLEYSGPTDTLYMTDLVVEATVHQVPHLVRYRGTIDPWEMTVDPVFAPSPELPDYDNYHVVQLAFAPGSTPSDTGAWLVLAPLSLIGLRRRRANP